MISKPQTGTNINPKTLTHAEKTQLHLAADKMRKTKQPDTRGFLVN